MLPCPGPINSASNRLRLSNTKACMTNRRHKRRQQRYFSGWRVGVAVGTVATTIVLLTNVISTIYITQHYQVVEQGIYTIIGSSADSCLKAKKWLHMLINIAGTSLLSASNYCMQCLSLPTRQEVDLAHKKQKWLDVGIPTMKIHVTLTRKEL